MKINILTLFPEAFESFLNHSIIKRAIENEYVEVNLYNFRDYANNKNNSVDDTSYGGGAGMVLQVEPIHKCLSSIDKPGLVIATTPTGKPLNDNLVNELANEESITILCGHYEGFDERVYDYVDQEVSIGDYVLTGGETAAFVLIDAITRKVEGVIKDESVANDSFVNGIFDYPVYTKPLEYDGKSVPDILLSGNHQEIAKWRYKKALEKTYLRRKDLIDNNQGSIDKEVLARVIEENKGEI